jgi:hypothetical protein
VRRRRRSRPLVLVPARAVYHRARRRWANLADNAGIASTCDDRLCAKLAKGRKRAWRVERRFVRRLLKGAAP